MNVPFRTILLASLFAARSAFAQTYTTLHDFSAGAGHPQAPLFEAADGKVWGTTYDGGVYGAGSIFTLTPDGLGGFTYAERHAFVDDSTGKLPTAGLVQAADGRLYGVTISTIFRIDADGSNFQTVHVFDFSEGFLTESALIEGSDGLLYGVAPNFGPSNHGTLFAFDPSDNTLTVIHDFDNLHGANPNGSLIEGTDGRLYGTTASGGANGVGTVFGIDKTGGNFDVLHDCSFSDGAFPYSALIQLADGFLYGTTTSGPNNYGVAFKIDTNGNNFEVLHQFLVGEGIYPSGSLVQGADGLLYGPASDFSVIGTIYRLNSSGGSFEVVHTFAVAEGGSGAALLRRADNSLFGTTSTGGDGGNGSVFQLDPATGDITVLYAFVSPDAFNSLAGLVFGPGGFLYGTAGQGGPHGSGALFRIDPSGASYSILHGFGGTDGAGPTTPVLGTDGSFYGTTTAGGGFGGTGTVFRIDSDGANFSVIHAFNLGEGNQPYGVIQAADGKLYGGTLTFGGQFPGGVIYRLDTDGQNFEILHQFTGGGPQAPLLQAADGKLYGTTFQGGAHDFGTVFRMDLDGGNFETLHEFAGPDGRGPTAALIQSAGGKLYGTTTQGGTSGDWGVVFELDPSGSSFRVTHLFRYFDGGYPYGPLLEGSDGFLYGTTVYGTIYRINPVATPAFSNVWGSNFARLHVFDFFHGSGPYGGLVQGADGSLYGTTNQGGAYFGGVVYKLELAPLRASRPRTVTRR